MRYNRLKIILAFFLIILGIIGLILLFINSKNFIMIYRYLGFIICGFAILIYENLIITNWEVEENGFPTKKKSSIVNIIGIIGLLLSFIPNLF